jgi:hypothetical protein
LSTQIKLAGGLGKIPFVSRQKSRAQRREALAREARHVELAERQAASGAPLGLAMKGRKAQETAKALHDELAEGETAT